MKKIQQKITIAFGLLFLFGFESVDYGQLISPTTSFLWGMNGHPLTQASYKIVSLEKQFAMLNQLNIKGYRIDVSLKQNDLIRNKKSIDSILRLCKIDGITLLPMVYTSNIVTDFNKGAAYYEVQGKEYAKLFYQYFADCHYVEIGNENETHYKTQLYDIKSGKVITNTGDYARLVSEAAYMRGFISQIHMLNPRIQTMVNFAFGDSWYLKALDRLGVDFDIIADHIYTNVSWIDERAHSGPTKGSFADMLTDIYEYFKGKKSIWLTEYNYPQGSTKATSAAQRLAIENVINSISSYSYVKALFFYELIDDYLLPQNVDESERHYGFTQYNSSTKSLVIKPFFKK